MKFGTEFRAYRENSFNNINDWTGRFEFVGDLVRGPNSTSAERPAIVVSRLRSSCLACRVIPIVTLRVWPTMPNSRQAGASLRMTIGELRPD